MLRGLGARDPYFHNGSAQDLQLVHNARFDIGLTRGSRDLATFLGALYAVDWSRSRRATRPGGCHARQLRPAPVLGEGSCSTEPERGAAEASDTVPRTSAGSTNTSAASPR